MTLKVGLKAEPQSSSSGAEKPDLNTISFSAPPYKKAKTASSKKDHDVHDVSCCFSI